MLSGLSDHKRGHGWGWPGLSLLLTALLGVFGGAPTWACTAEYVSPETLLKTAQCVIEVEVLSVGNVPEPPDPMESDGAADGSAPAFDLFFAKPESAEDRRDAQAEVRVIETIKGTCPVTSLTVVGGPYSSCDPHAAYVKFEKGTRFFLILAQALKAETRTIVLWQRGCLWGGSVSEMRELISKGQEAWARMRDRYEKADPAAFARATELVAVVRKGNFEKPEAEPFAVLACLWHLLADPAVAGDRAPVLQSDEQPGTAPARTDIVVAGNGRRARSSVLEEALTKRREERPDEAVALNRVMVARVLVDELKVPADLVARLLPEKHPNRRTLNALTDCDSPFRYVFEPSGKDDPDVRVIGSLNMLLSLAGDEPDRLVHNSFGLGLGDYERSPFEPALFAPFIAAHVKSVALDDWGRLQVLLLLPHPGVVPVVSEALRKERNAGRLDSYARFFVWMDDASGFRVVVDRFLDLAAAELAGKRDRETDDPGRYLGYTARKIGALCKRSDGEWGAARERINAFASRFPEK